jgi:hypothetical protein
MRVGNFFQPVEEVVKDSQSNIMASILAPYQHPREVETNEEPEVIPRASLSKAVEAIETLRLYEEQAEDGKVEWVNALHGQKKVI